MDDQYSHEQSSCENRSELFLLLKYDNPINEYNISDLYSALFSVPLQGD